jgi:uncharacterized metal-binding protein YceD (DUF177 family)
MRQDVQTHEYLLDNLFFAHIDGEDVQKGKIRVELTVSRMADAFHLSFRLNGTAVIPCDRCLDDMDYPIETTARLIVKFGKDYAEESDEIVVVPEAEGVINLAWFLYEFVALAIPIKHVHAPGKCNKQMSVKLKKHTAKSADDADADETFDMDGDDIIVTTDDDTTDPRWDALKNLELD